MATIALVDDDKNILASVTMLLEQEGYHVRSYTDGASALTALTANPPDMAILDIKMPRMDGMELLRRLRQSMEIPVIFLTSKDEEIDELMGLNAGADDYVRKPFSQRLLLERVKAVLRRAEGKKPGSATATRRVDGLSAMAVVTNDSDGVEARGATVGRGRAMRAELPYRPHRRFSALTR